MNEQRIPLRQRRELSDIIQAALHLYTKNSLPLVSIAALVIPLGVASAALQSAIDDEVAEPLAILALSALQLIASVAASGAIIAALQANEAGQPVEFGSAVDAAFARLGTLFGATLRAMGIFLLLFITVIGIPWAIRQIVRWLFVAQPVMIDDKGVVGATDRSAYVVIGSWWRTFGYAIIIGIVGAVPTAVVAGVFFGAPVLVAGTANAIVNAGVLPFGVIAMTLLYLDLCVRKEAIEAGHASS